MLNCTRVSGIVIPKREVWPWLSLRNACNKQHCGKHRNASPGSASCGTCRSARRSPGCKHLTGRHKGQNAWRLPRGAGVMQALQKERGASADWKHGRRAPVQGHVTQSLGARHHDHDARMRRTGKTFSSRWLPTGLSFNAGFLDLQGKHQSWLVPEDRGRLVWRADAGGCALKHSISLSGPSLRATLA